MPTTDIRTPLRSLLCLFFLAILVAPTAALAEDPESKTTKNHRADDGELMIKESFQVGNGQNLVVSVNDADVEVETYGGSEALVEVYLEGRNMSKAKTYFEDQNYEVTQEGANVYIKTYPKKKSYNWHQIGEARIRVYVRVPSDFNVNIKTDDGDISVDDVQGEVLIATSDGDISTGEFSGPIVKIRTSDGDINTEDLNAPEVLVATSDGDITLDNVESDELTIRTSDGDISARYLKGVTVISTSDGDISIRSVEGDDITVRTSDGEVEVDQVDATRSQFTTSDGNITLGGVSGELTAKTSDGNLDVTLADATDITLRAGDGDVYIRAPRDYSADLYLKGERVDLSSRFQFSGTLKKNQANGEINGGRYSLEARSGGRIVLEGN